MADDSLVDRLVSAIHDSGESEELVLLRLARQLGFWISPIPLSTIPPYVEAVEGELQQVMEFMDERGVDPEDDNKRNIAAWTGVSKEWAKLGAGENRAKETVAQVVWWELLSLADNDLIIEDAQRMICHTLDMPQSNVSRTFKRLKQMGLLNEIAYDLEGKKVWRLGMPLGFR